MRAAVEWRRSGATIDPWTVVVALSALSDSIGPASVSAGAGSCRSGRVSRDTEIPHLTYRSPEPVTARRPDGLVFDPSVRPRLPGRSSLRPRSCRQWRERDATWARAASSAASKATGECLGAPLLTVTAPWLWSMPSASTKAKGDFDDDWAVVLDR